MTATAYPCCDWYFINSVHQWQTSMIICRIKIIVLLVCACTWTCTHSFLSASYTYIKVPRACSIEYALSLGMQNWVGSPVLRCLSSIRTKTFIHHFHNTILNVFYKWYYFPIIDRHFKSVWACFLKGEGCFYWSIVEGYVSWSSVHTKFYVLFRV